MKGLTQFSQCLTETRFNPFLVCRTLLCRHHLAWKVSLEHIRWTRKAFIFLKEPTKEEIWRSKDLLNSGISWTSFKKTYPISFICEVAKMINWRTNEEDLNHNRRLQLNFSSWHKHLQTTIIMKPCTFEFKWWWFELSPLPTFDRGFSCKRYCHSTLHWAIRINIILLLLICMPRWRRVKWSSVYLVS